jgi:ketosteroid isomerase-like protein
MSMRGHCLFVGVAIAATLTACSQGAASSTPSATQVQADTYAIEQIEVNWHKASSTKDVDLMMSLWADNATFNVGTQNYTGKDQIKAFFTNKAAPFRSENRWISETPAYKIRVTVNGDTGTLYFECHYVDINTRQIRAVVSADSIVSRINGKWLITQSITATPILSP